MKTSFSQMFGEALGRVLDKGDFVEGEHPRGHGGKFTRKMGATERAPAYSLKKYKAGGGISYRMYVGRKLVGHISGFEEDKKIDGTWTPVFHIYRAHIDEGMRGKGMYRSAVQVVANQYAGGAYVHSWEASGDLKRALGKLPTHRIDEENERIRVLPEGEKPKEEPKPPEKPASGPDYETAQSFMDIGKKHPDVPFFMMPQQDGTIELVVITVPEGERSKGKGSAVMRDLTAHADSKGITLTLKVAEAKEVGEENRARLFEFYKRFGFVPNDEGKYNKRSSDMYREPVGKPEPEVSKDGTSEGAIKGWETRRGRASAQPEGRTQVPKFDSERWAQRVVRLNMDNILNGDNEFAVEVFYNSRTGKMEERVSAGDGPEVKISRPKDLIPVVSFHNHLDAPAELTEWDEEVGQEIADETGRDYTMYVAGVEDGAVQIEHVVFSPRKISKEGTTEGAIKGWETRRRGGPPIPPKGYFQSAKTRIRDLAREGVDELEQEIENNRKRIPSDYMGMIRRDEARRRQGYEMVREAAQRLAGIRPHPGDAEKMGMLLRYAEMEAEKVSQRDGEKSWDEEFSDYLTAAGAIAERAARVH